MMNQCNCIPVDVCIYVCIGVCATVKGTIFRQLSLRQGIKNREFGSRTGYHIYNNLDRLTQFQNCLCWTQTAVSIYCLLSQQQAPLHAWCLTQDQESSPIVSFHTFSAVAHSQGIMHLGKIKTIIFLKH